MTVVGLGLSGCGADAPKLDLSVNGRAYIAQCVESDGNVPKTPSSICRQATKRRLIKFASTMQRFYSINQQKSTTYASDVCGSYYADKGTRETSGFLHFVEIVQSTLPNSDPIPNGNEGLPEENKIVGLAIAQVCPQFFDKWLSDQYLHELRDEGYLKGPTRSATASASSPPAVGEASPSVSPSGVDCSTFDEVRCQEANAVASECNSGSTALAYDRQVSPGLAKFTYGVDGNTALVSGDYHAGVFVESCGRPTNGIDDLALHRDLVTQATSTTSGTGGLGRVAAVVCHAKSPIDTAPVGTRVNCDVFDSNGYPNQAQITVTSAGPRYTLKVDFGD